MKLFFLLLIVLTSAGKKDGKSNDKTAKYNSKKQSRQDKKARKLGYKNAEEMLNDKGSIEVPAWMLTIYGAEVEDDEMETTASTATEKEIPIREMETKPPTTTSTSTTTSTTTTTTSTTTTSTSTTTSTTTTLSEKEQKRRRKKEKKKRKEKGLSPHTTQLPETRPKVPTTRPTSTTKAKTTTQHKAPPRKPTNAPVTHANLNAIKDAVAYQIWKLIFGGSSISTTLPPPPPTYNEHAPLYGGRSDGPKPFQVAEGGVVDELVPDDPNMGTNHGFIDWDVFRREEFDAATLLGPPICGSKKLDLELQCDDCDEGFPRVDLCVKFGGDKISSDEAFKCRINCGPGYAVTGFNKVKCLDGLWKHETKGKKDAMKTCTKK